MFSDSASELPAAVATATPPTAPIPAVLKKARRSSALPRDDIILWVMVSYSSRSQWLMEKASVSI